MSELFLNVVDMSLSASIVMLAVLALRLLLKGAPKKWSYLLWSVVGFRLCCPVSVRAVFSLFRALPARPTAAEVTAPASVPASAMEYVPRNIAYMPRPQVNVGVPAINQAVSDSLPAATPLNSMNPMQFWIFLAALIWVAGMAVLLGVSLWRYHKTHRLVLDAVRAEEGVYETDAIDSPFILGFFHPVIYLPLGLEGERRRYVLEHERYHLKRRDHLTRLFAFLLLAIHWFNPLVWLGYYLMGKDMEMSCDEAVLGMEEGREKEYSATLLSFAVAGRFPGLLAFGEASVKSRIRNALNWRRPHTWVSLVAGALCVALVAACAVNPVGEPPKETESPVEIPAVTESPSPSPQVEAPSPAMMQIPIPEEYADLVEVESTVDRVTVYEKKSREDFRADFEKDPWPDYDHPDQVGMGWLCTLERVSEAEMLEMRVGDMSGVTFFGRDDTGEYVRLLPTDVRFYREGGTLDDPEGWQTWEDLQKWAATLDQAYLAQHPEVKPYLRTNTEADIFLTRAACWDLDLVLSADGVTYQIPAGSDHTKAYARRLAEDYTFAWVDVDTVKEVLSKPNLALAATTQGEDYWSVEFWPGENIVQVVEGDMLMLFRATPREGVAQPIGDVAQTWFDEAQSGGGVQEAPGPEDAGVLSAALAQLLETASAPRDSAISVSLLVEGGADRGYDVSWADNCASFARGIAESFTYRLFGGEEVPTLVRQIQHSNRVMLCLSQQDTMEFFEGTDLMRLTQGDTLSFYRAQPKIEDILAPDPYALARMWFDECEFNNLLVGSDVERVNYSGSDYLAAAGEFYHQYEGLHTRVSPGSKSRYESALYTTVEDAPEATQAARQRGEIWENTWAFFGTTIFIPENQRARDWSMAGNTMLYSEYVEEYGPLSDAPTGLPENAYIYFRCGYVTRQEDGTWKGSIVGTGW